MSFLGYKDAEDMMKKTGFPPEKCLKLIDAELERIRTERDIINQKIPRTKDRYDSMTTEQLIAECKRRGLL